MDYIISDDKFKACAFKFISQMSEKDTDKKNAVIEFVNFLDEEVAREEKEREEIWK